MPTFTATEIVELNNYTIITGTTGDFTAINAEKIIDNAIDTINSDAGSSIAYMTGVAGSKTVTFTGAQNAAFQPLITMRLREAQKTRNTSSDITNGSESTSKSWGLGPLNSSEGSSVGTAISAAAAINSGANTIELEMYRTAITRLRSRNFMRA